MSERTSRRFAILGAALSACGLVKAQHVPLIKGKNNHCPVCGTDADPFVMPRTTKVVPCNPPSPAFVCTAQDEPYGDPWRMVRCKNCNVVFVQDGV